MRVVVTITARQELQEHIAYIADQDPEAAQRQYDRILEAVDALQDYPRRGRPGRVEGTRELVISGTSYVAIYEVGTDVVTIVHIIHGRQQWPREQ